MRTLAKVGLIGWTALMGLWFVSAMMSTASNNDCLSEACETGRNIGAGIGVVLIMFVAMVGYVILGIFWAVGRPNSRPCPACGVAVATGIMRCSTCGHDFQATASGNGARWAQDPVGRHELRYWDGANWTASVSDSGAVATDPV